jgi:hypothetical protein
MKRCIIRNLLLILTIIIVINITFYKKSYSWGFWAHAKINGMAVFTLPPQMIGFYKENFDYITQHATDPDKLRYIDPNEAPHHFINLEHYGKFPYTELPHDWYAAVKKFSADTLDKYGVVPWQVQVVLKKLTAAFREGSKYKILKYSSFIGHYIADADVPLHCTINYNGQLTNQTGIHAFWESRIPELFGDTYDYFVGKAFFISHPLNTMWKIVLQSNYESDTVLADEKELMKTFPGNDQYVLENKSGQMMKVYTEDFSKAYQAAMHNMEERKMRQSILLVGSFWYTAWVNAGKPDLSQLKNDTPSVEEQTEINRMQAQWQQGNILGQPEN